MTGCDRKVSGLDQLAALETLSTSGNQVLVPCISSASTRKILSRGQKKLDNEIKYRYSEWVF